MDTFISASDFESCSRYGVKEVEHWYTIAGQNRDCWFTPAGSTATSGLQLARNGAKRCERGRRNRPHHHLAQLLTGDAIATQGEGNAVLVIVWP
jgi:hypothetical protein